MMIDMEALKAACEGDPDAKVSVKRKWLKEVYRELSRRDLHRKTDDLLAKVGSKIFGYPSA